MSIRPLDIGLTVQRTTEINRSQTNEGVRPETLMQHSGEKIQRDVHLLEQTVLQTNKSEDNSVNRDGRGNGGGSGGKRKKKGGKKEEEKLKQGGLLDISG